MNRFSTYSELKTGLPIESVLPEIRSALSEGTAAVVQAPPGAGKTTLVPIALLAESWMENRRMVMLEPRRLAARTAAHRMSFLLNEKIGQTVGYRVRLDTVVSQSTRIEVVTEGVLTRMLNEDPALEKYGMVIFDEFHERSLHSDLGLALLLQARQFLREDLRLLVMSATLDGGRVAELLGGVPVITSSGRSFPVETRYLEHAPEDPIEPVVVQTISQALSREPGDILLFLPGSGEIRRVEQVLKSRISDDRIRVIPLYGNLPQPLQDAAIQPSLAGERKIVLSTSIAETSLTIEGIRIVVDSGLSRVPRFSPRTGMTRLHTVRVSRASADQRRGRAGRLGPGVCYRLWTRHMQAQLAPFTTPEIVEADLAPLALELAEWGTSDPAELKWLDPPPQAAFMQARELLIQLGALDSSHSVTPHGRQMARLALHPRIAHLVLNGIALGHGYLACAIAALLNERDLFKSAEDLVDADLRLRLDILHHHTTERSSPFAVDSGTLGRIQKELHHLKRQLRVPSGRVDVEACGFLLAFAFPDRIAQRRVGRTGSFLLRNGQSAVLPRHQYLAESDYIVAAELGGLGKEHRIYRGAPISEEDILSHFDEHVTIETVVTWDRDLQSVRSNRVIRLGALVLRENAAGNVDPEIIVAALMDGIRQEGLQILPWTKQASQLKKRIQFMHLLDPSYPEFSDESLLQSASDWLAPYVYGLQSRQDLQKLNLCEILQGQLDRDQFQRLERWAPTHITVPSGSRIPIDYDSPESPILAVRLQEMFGATETPCIGNEKVPLMIHLLSPANRPVQITRDLKSFWKTGYFDVRKDLKGRYPKHYWPDNPLEAIPTRRIRPR